MLLDVKLFLQYFTEKKVTHSHVVFKHFYCVIYIVFLLCVSTLDL